MTSNKGKTSADNKAAQKANETALVHFPTRELTTAFKAMSKQATAEDTASGKRGDSALTVLDAVHGYAAANAEHPIAVILEGLNAGLIVFCMAMATAGNKYAVLTPAEGDKPAKAKFTGYGNNVISTARGMLEHSIDPATCIDTETKAPSYRAAQANVQEARQEKRRVDNPELAAINDARTALDNAWKVFRTLVVDTNDGDLLAEGCALVTAITAEFQSGLDAQAALDAEATAAIDAEAEIAATAQADTTAVAA